MKVLALSTVFLSLLSFGKVDWQDIRIIQPKKNEVVMKKAYKSFHGKKIIREEKKLISTKPVDNNPILIEYVKNLSKKLNKELVLKPSKKRQAASFRIQIQKAGYFDVLNIQSKDPKLVQQIENWLRKQERFDPLPDNAGQQELQLEFPLK